MKTPDEIKKGLECFGGHCDMNCDGCEFDTGYTARSQVMRDALVYIRQLEGQNAEQAARLEQVTRERDAAVKQVKEFGDCQCCTHDEICKDLFPDCGDCNNVQCPCNSCKADTRNNWEWRGVPQEVEQRGQH